MENGRNNVHVDHFVGGSADLLMFKATTEEGIYKNEEIGEPICGEVFNGGINFWGKIYGKDFEYLFISLVMNVLCFPFPLVIRSIYFLPYLL